MYKDTIIDTIHKSTHGQDLRSMNLSASTRAMLAFQ